MSKLYGLGVLAVALAGLVMGLLGKMAVLAEALLHLAL
jgi:hypothetical protein